MNKIELLQSVALFYDLSEKELGKEIWEKEAKALNNQAAVVLRVNTLKTKKEKPVKPKKEKPFKKHGIETFMSNASFGTMGAGGRNHLD